MKKYEEDTATEVEPWLNRDFSNFFNFTRQSVSLYNYKLVSLRPIHSQLGYQNLERRSLIAEKKKKKKITRNKWRKNIGHKLVYNRNTNQRKLFDVKKSNFGYCQ